MSHLKLVDITQRKNPGKNRWLTQDERIKTNYYFNNACSKAKVISSLPTAIALHARATTPTTFNLMMIPNLSKQRHNQLFNLRSAQVAKHLNIRWKQSLFFQIHLKEVASNYVYLNCSEGKTFGPTCVISKPDK